MQVTAPPEQYMRTMPVGRMWTLDIPVTIKGSRALPKFYTDLAASVEDCSGAFATGLECSIWQVGCSGLLPHDSYRELTCGRGWQAQGSGLPPSGCHRRGTTLALRCRLQGSGPMAGRGGRLPTGRQEGMGVACSSSFGMKRVQIA